MPSMYRTVLWSWLTLPGWGSFALAQGAQGGARAVDPVFTRAQQMVTAGQDVAGRAVIDSVLAVTPEDTPRYAEALFWRATFSKTAAAAERDYRRISIEYPLSPRAQESLLRLAQLEKTRGDRAGARVHLERIQREHPTGPTSVRASVTLAQLAFDDGDAEPRRGADPQHHRGHCRISTCGRATNAGVRGRDARVQRSGRGVRHACRG